jgi:hypothetical protein
MPLIQHMTHELTPIETQPAAERIGRIERFKAAFKYFWDHLGTEHLRREHGYVSWQAGGQLEAGATSHEPEVIFMSPTTLERPDPAVTVARVGAEQARPDAIWSVAKPDVTRAMLREARAARLRRQQSV